MLVYFKHTKRYTSIFSNLFKNPETTYIFKNNDGFETIVKINQDNQTIEAVCQKELTPEEFRALNEGIYQGKCIFSNKWSPDESVDSKIVNDYFNDILEMQSDAIKSVEKAFKLVKYLLNQYNWELITACSLELWSIDGITWERVPFVGGGGMCGPHIPFTENSDKIQSSIDSGFEPFIALDFLYKARIEENTKFKWIYATIAAELAIKEFLIRKEPKYEILLNEMPAPPISKLYGKILKEVSGIDSFFKPNDIQEYADVRNRLLHRPEDVEINSMEAAYYIQFVSTLIFQLLSNLYPENEIIKKYHFPPICEFPKPRKVKFGSNPKKLIYYGR